jgi:hypothetical protein
MAKGGGRKSTEIHEAVIAISLFLFSKEKRKTLEKTQKHQRCFVLGNFYRNFLEKREGALLRRSPSLADAADRMSIIPHTRTTRVSHISNLRV